MSSSSTKLVIAIDYGTTNTGVGYAFLPDPNDDSAACSVIRRWPHGQLSRDASDKLPSDIAYDQAGKPLKYGFECSELPEDVQVLQWIKLLLEPAQFKGMQNTPSTERVWRSYEELKRLKTTPIEAIGDYLAWLWVLVRKHVEEAEDDHDVFTTADVTVVFTLPASWSDRAKDGMQKAVRRSGIGSEGRTIKYRVEPEAAAIFELKVRAKKKQISVGDCIIVCDAGGGTVDVVSFQVLSVQPLSLDQVVISKGDFCGSAFVDAEFESQLRSILGGDFKKLGSLVQNQIREEFEYKIKRRYHPEKSAEYSIPVTGLKDDETRCIKDGRLKLDNAVLHASFESIMTQILTLIDDQKDELQTKGLDRKLRGILLVGGFGGSEYLHTRIRQEYPEDEDVKVWRGDQTWTSVVQGAVACEVANRDQFAPVNTRLSKYNYGIPYRLGSAKKVAWLVRKGQDVRSTSHIEPYALRMEDQDWLQEDSFAKVLVQLVKTEEDDVNEDLDPSVRPHIEIICRIPTDIRHSPEALLIQENPKVWRIPAELVLVMDGPILTVRCRIKGEDVGAVDLKYHDDSRLSSQIHRPATKSIDTTPRQPSQDATDSVLSQNFISRSVTVPEKRDESTSPVPTPRKSSGTWLPFSMKRDKSKEGKDKEKSPALQPVRTRESISEDGEWIRDEAGRRHKAPPKYPEFPGLF